MQSIRIRSRQCRGRRSRSGSSCSPVLLGLFHQPSPHRISAGISYDGGAAILAVNVVVVAPMPTELHAVALQLPRCCLLQHLDELRHKDGERFIHRQMHVLGHEGLGVHSGRLPGAYGFQSRIKGFPCSCLQQKWKPAAAAERDEVRRLGALKSLQTGWHGFMGAPEAPAHASHDDAVRCMGHSQGPSRIQEVCVGNLPWNDHCDRGFPARTHPRQLF